MKKLSTVVLALFMSLNLFAGVIISEGFSTWLPTGWSVANGPGTSSYSHWFHRNNSIATVYVTNDNQDEWLISPEFLLPSVGELRLSVDMMGSFYRMVTIDKGDLLVYASTDGGTSWDTIWKEDDQAMVTASGVAWPYGNNQWFFPSININSYAGQNVKIAFRYISPDGDADWWNLDNFLVTSLVQNDVILENFAFPEYGLINDAISFQGIFRNVGINDVTSFEAMYIINSVDSVAYQFNNTNVTYNDTYSFTHGIPYTFSSAEIFDLVLKISKVNGVNDPIPANNILYRDISIAASIVNRKPFFEVFTSSTCPTCPGTNNAVDGVLANNPGNYGLVKYQVDWPGNGDPYWIPANTVRKDYYGVGGVPDLYINGIFEPAGSSFNQLDFNAVANEGAYGNLQLNYYFSGINVGVTVDFTPTINILDASIHIAIVEKTTYNNVGTNGETEFHNVLMKMLPDAYGNLMNLEIGVPVSISESTTLDSTFIEEFNDLEVVVWVQDNETRYVLQSESSELIVGISDPEDQNFTIFPNPAHDIIFLNSTTSGFIKILDINGRILKEQTIVEGYNQINISQLPKGVYFLQKISDEYSSIKVFKLIKL